MLQTWHNLLSQSLQRKESSILVVFWPNKDVPLIAPGNRYADSSNFSTVWNKTSSMAWSVRERAALGDIASWLLHSFLPSSTSASLKCLFSDFTVLTLGLQNAEDIAECLLIMLQNEHRHILRHTCYIGYILALSQWTGGWENMYFR